MEFDCGKLVGKAIKVENLDISVNTGLWIRKLLIFGDNCKYGKNVKVRASDMSVRVGTYDEQTFSAMTAECGPEGSPRCNREWV